MKLRTLALAALALGCGAEESAPAPTPEAGERLQVVEPGKEDNFFSQSAQEYALTGRTTVRIEDEYASEPLEVREARARALAPFRQTVVGWFLNAYMVEKSHDASNAEHGGFKALTKNGSWADLGLVEIDAQTFELEFRQEIAGPLNLLSVLPTETDEAGHFFDLQMGLISTEEMQRMDHGDEWYRKAPWKAFDPSEVEASRLETARLYIEAQPRSTDAWFDYARLIDDGVLDVGVHFGWDYHNAYHQVHSKTIFQWLVGEGFEAPVASHTELRRDSGPLTKQVLTPMGPVTVKISLYWGEPGTATDPDTDAGGRALEADMRASLKERDVIVFSGHSGPFYGFALANWRKTDEGDVDDTELPSVEMPERYQVVLAEGCDTYAIGQGFFLNPAKVSRDNLDIITTTSFSNAGADSTVREFLKAFVETDAEDVPKVPTLGELLRDLDNNSWWFTTMYGVHGIDDNPRVHPWANQAGFGASCSEDSDCGSVGNRCVGEGTCTYECTADEACGAGALCQKAQEGGWITTKVCVPSAEPVVDVQVARAVPNPDTDHDGDGELNAYKDEIVVLVNLGDATADLKGWTLSDARGVVFTFAEGSFLDAGETLTVYGGGEHDFVAPRGLKLNNTGDTLTLADERGGLVQTLSWDRVSRGEVIQP